MYHNITFDVLPPYDICHLAKQKCLPFPNSQIHASCFFELIHVDIWGPIAHTSLDGFNYFLTMVDDHTHFTWVHLLQNKSMV